MGFESPPEFADRRHHRSYLHGAVGVEIPKTAKGPEENVMAKFELSIDVSYQKDQWGLWEAYREILSNAIDAQTRFQNLGKGEMKIKFVEESSELRISNRGIRVEESALLMGTSESRDRSDTIGQFGEGLPMALLTLARMDGYGVKVYNDTHGWYPSIERSTVFNRDVLVVSTRKLKKPRGKFEVVIEGFTKENWDDFKKLFLTTDPDFDPRHTIAPYEDSYRKARILLQPQYEGCLFNKGVFVNRREDLRFGYDLDMELNRDRHLMDEWDLKWRLGEMVGKAASTHPERILKTVMEMVEDGSSLEIQSASLAYGSDIVVKEAARLFNEQHGESAVPVSSLAESKEMAHYGKKGVIVSRQMKNLIEMVKGSYESTKNSITSKPKTIFGWGDLTEEEQENLTYVSELVQGTAFMKKTGLDLLNITSVVEFYEESTLGKCKMGEAKSIEISRKVCDDLPELLKTVVHEVAHLNKSEDGSMEHSDAIQDIMIEIILSQPSR